MKPAVISRSKKTRDESFTVLRDIDLCIAIVLLVVVMSTTLLGVITRYVFSMSLQSVDEVSGILFVWFLYFSMIFCVRKNENIIVNIFDVYMSARVKLAIIIFANFTVLAFSAVMAKYSLGLVAYNVGRSGGETPMLSIPYYIVYAILPLAFSIFSIVTAWRIACSLWSIWVSPSGEDSADKGSL